MNSLSNLKSTKYNINEPRGDIINTNDTDLMIIQELRLVTRYTIRQRKRILRQIIKKLYWRSYWCLK